MIFSLAESFFCSTSWKLFWICMRIICYPFSCESPVLHHPCVYGTCWCERNMTLFYNYASNNSITMALHTWPPLQCLLQACVFPHSVWSSSVIWFHDRRKTPIKTDFRSENRLPALHTVSLLAVGGFRFSWEIVGKNITPWSVRQWIKLQQGSWKSTLLRVVTVMFVADRPTRSAFTDWALMVFDSSCRVTFISDDP